MASSDSLRRFSHWLAYYIAERKLSYGEIAGHIGIDKSTISNWKAGRNGPDLAKLDSVAEILGVDISALFAPIDAKPSQGLPSKMIITLEEALRVLKRKTGIVIPRQLIGTTSEEDPVHPTILFVDDDTFVRDEIATWLRIKHYQVFTADDYGQAINIVKSHHVSICVTDNYMPVKSGIWLLKTLKIKYPHICRILASGTAVMSDELQERCAPHAYISKPYNKVQLLETITDGWARFEQEKVDEAK